GVEGDERQGVASLVDLEDGQPRPGDARTDVAAFDFEVVPLQSQAITPSRKDLRLETRRAHLESQSQGLEMLIPIELELRQETAVDDTSVGREHLLESLPVASAPCGVEPVESPCGRVLDPRRPPLGRQLVEARERLGVAIGVEDLTARDPTVS